MRVLVAVPPPAAPFLADTLERRAKVVFSHTYDDAARRLHTRGEFDLVLCGVYFDRSRLFDLVKLVHRRLPVVCCRVLRFEMPSISMQALRIACETLGAEFIDLPALRQAQGDAAADAALLSLMRAAVKRRASGAPG
jgi:hypothetical protein